MIQINNLNYRDSKGNLASKEDYERERNDFERDYIDRYNATIESIANSIPEYLSDKEKLKAVYEYLVSSITYDREVLDSFTKDGLVHPVLHKTYNEWGLSGSEKYAPILLNKGICTGISEAFKDICDRLGIPCELISGKTIVIDEATQTRLGHTWNVVKIDGEVKHIDVRYGIKNRDEGKDIMDFFLVDTEKLKRNGPHNSIDEIAFGQRIY